MTDSPPVARWPVCDGRAAAAAAVAAARRLVVPGVVTAGLLGATAAAEAQLEALPAALPELTHIALHDGDWGRTDDLVERWLPPLRRAGVHLSATRSAVDAVLGADLVVCTTASVVHRGWLTPGAVLVSVAPVAWCVRLAACADRLVRGGGPAPAPRHRHRHRHETVLVDLCCPGGPTGGPTR